MRRKELARELARQQHIPAGKAQDQVDALVHEIIGRLRNPDAAKPGAPVKLAPKDRPKK